MLSNREKYPLFARTIETTALHNPAMMKVIELFGWTRVATITTDTEFVLPVSRPLLFQESVSISIDIWPWLDPI